MDSKWQIVSGNLYQKTNCLKNIMKMFFTVTTKEIKYKYVVHTLPENEISSAEENKLSAVQSRKSRSEEEDKRKKGEERIGRIEQVGLERGKQEKDVPTQDLKIGETLHTLTNNK